MRDYQRKAYNLIIDARQQHATCQIPSSRTLGDPVDGVSHEENASDLSPSENCVFNDVSSECIDECSETGATHDKDRPESSSEISSPDNLEVADLSITSEKLGRADSSLSNQRVSITAPISFSRQTSDINHSVVSKIQSLVDQMETMFTMTYEQLDTNTLPEEVRRALRSTVENSFYGQLWPHVTTLYRFVMYSHHI
jgi:hypothetical protein